MFLCQKEASSKCMERRRRESNQLINSICHRINRLTYSYSHSQRHYLLTAANYSCLLHWPMLCLLPYLQKKRRILRLRFDIYCCKVCCDHTTALVAMQANRQTDILKQKKIRDERGKEEEREGRRGKGEGRNKWIDAVDWQAKSVGKVVSVINRQRQQSAREFALYQWPLLLQKQQQIVFLTVSFSLLFEELRFF